VGDVFFYHLTRSTLEQTLPMLLERALGRAWRVCVRGADAARLEWLDRRLWEVPEEGFLPHGLAGGPHDADQPVLLTTGQEVANGAACLVVIDGAPLDPAEVADFDRVCVVFDGNDPRAVEDARGLWRRVTGAGHGAQYWSEETGRWQKKAEAAPRGGGPSG